MFIYLIFKLFLSYFKVFKMFLSELFNELKNILITIQLIKLNSNILFLGLDNSGKTTLITILERDKLCLTPPSIHPCKYFFILKESDFN